MKKRTKRIIISLLLAMLLVGLYYLPALAESAAEAPTPIITLTGLVEAAIVVIMGIITRYVVPWIKAKYLAEQLQGMSYWAQVLVAAAEQIYTGQGKGAEKLKWVTNELLKRGYALDTGAVRALIEDQVYKIKHPEVGLEVATLIEDADG